MKYKRDEMMKKLASRAEDLEIHALAVDGEERHKYETRYGDPVALRAKVAAAMNQFITAFDYEKVSELPKIAYELRDASLSYVIASKPFVPSAGNTLRADAARAREIADLLTLSSDDFVTSTELENLGAYAILKGRR